MHLSKRVKLYQRRAAKALLNHLCDYQVMNVPVVDDNDTQTRDEFGHLMYENGDLEENLRCLFLWQDLHLEGNEGNTTNKVPVLYMSHGEAVVTGGVVRNVRSRDGTVLLVSAFIETIDSTAEGGDSAMLMLTLSGAVTE